MLMQMHRNFLSWPVSRLKRQGRWSLSSVR